MHIAYISMGAVGHVLASLPFCGELVKKGHRVSYFTAEFLREQVEPFGVEFHPVSSPLNKGGEGDKDALSNLLAEIPMRFLNEGACGAPDIIKVLENDRPDVIVHDTMAVSGRLAASYLDVPRVQFFTSFAANEHYNATMGWPEDIDETEPRKRALKFAEELQEKYKGELITPQVIFAGSADFNLVTVDKYFQPAAETFGDNFVFVGPQIAERAGEDKWQGPDNGKKTLYASLGTVFNNLPHFWPMLFEAVKDMDINLICSIGNMVDPASFGEIPENVTLYQFLPQLKVLQTIDGFVTHGGTGSVMEASWFAVPMLCIPQMEDQFVNADTIMELKTGTSIIGAENLSTEALRKGIEEILTNPEYKKNAEKIAADMHATGGPANAADALIKWCSR